MSDESTHTVERLKRTALYPLHAALHAKLGPFGGWELPIYYSSILQEHQAVRTAVGVFDVSHLGHLEVSGQGAAAALQPLYTQDIVKLPAGKAIYSPMLDGSGFIIDEMILYRLAPDRIRIVANAANADKVLARLRERVSGARVEDLREKFGTLAVQGPKAVELVNRMAGGALSGASRYSITPGTIAGASVFFARTGYTGEDGFEAFVPTADLPKVWNSLLDAGCAPVGLGARDTLRLEAGLPLGGSDLDEKTTPLEARLDWTIAWDKGQFEGREALEKQKQQGITRRLAGFKLTGAGIPRHGYPILIDGREAGVVTSGTTLPQTGPIGLGFVPPQSAAPGTRIAVAIHGREVPGEVVKLPFYKFNKTG
jgi:aminomethyltransferase